MNISNELLAAYAENNVSPEERQEVRQYLTDHPSELESVMVMMDDGYDMEPTCNTDTLSRVLSIDQDESRNNSTSDLKLKVADFSPGAKGHIYQMGKVNSIDRFCK